MSEYIFKNVKPFEVEKETKGTFIVLLNVLKTPPHFLLLIDGYLYGVSVKGAVIAVDFNQYKNWIDRRVVKTLFLEFKKSFSFESMKLMEDQIKSHPMVNLEGNTCLSPIKTICKSEFGVDVTNVHRIFDLLPLIEKKLENVFHLNLDDNIDNNNLSLQQYTKEDILNGIVIAQNKFKSNA